jgi:hypothetical protein
MRSDEVIFFTDTGSYGVPRGRLRESEKLKREIDALIARKWDNPEDRDEIDAQVLIMRKRLEFLRLYPEEDNPQ